MRGRAVTRPRAATTGVMSRFRASATMTSGGSRLTDDIALTVIPAGSPASSSVVMTLMPVANRPMTSRNASPSICTAGVYRRAPGVRPGRGARRAHQPRQRVHIRGGQGDRSPDLG